MKKIFTFLILALAVCCFKGFAQSNPNCNAAFTFTVTGNTVQFVPGSNVDSSSIHHYWSFGDNSTLDSSYAPIHTYSAPGVYAVIQTVKRITLNGVVCTDTYTAVIVINGTAPCSIHASYSITRPAGSTNTIVLNNLSSPTSDIHYIGWDFGDGQMITTSSLSPITHVYGASGLFTVCLLVKRDSTCMSDTCQPVQIQVPTTCNLQAACSYNVDTIHHIVNYTNLSSPITSIDSVTWVFGDSTVSHDLNPSHTYASAGSYNVCLYIAQTSVPGTVPCTSHYCHTVNIPATTVPCNVTAGFTITAGNTPGVFYFTNTTTPVATNDSLTWSFGDSTSSSAFSPTHTYLHSGTYNVCLIVKRNNGSSTPCVSYICHTVTVNIPPVCNIQAAFSYTVDSLTHTIHCTNLSSGTIDTLYWSFGDSTTSFDHNPSHTYANSGTYTVCLNVVHYNTSGTVPCTSHYCQNINIPSTTAPCNITAAYTYQTGSASGSVYFNNATIGLSPTDSITWIFGDSSANSHDANPVHVYNHAGTYSACLIVKKSPYSGTTPCISYVCHNITIALVCNLAASFTFTTDTATRTVHFTNTSTTPADSLVWFFGDGTSSSLQNPVHTYANYGVYNICLKLKNAPVVGSTAVCQNYSCHLDTIPAPTSSCNVTAGFTFAAGNTPGVFYFNNTTTPVATNDSLTWTFGDSTSSNAYNPVHTYLHSGTYTVCLIVRRNSNTSSTPCVSYICHTITVTLAPACNLAASFTYTNDSATNTVHFTNTSSTQADSTFWYFGDGTSSSLQNPVHTYANAGVYTICLKIKNVPVAGTTTLCQSYSCHIDTIPVQVNPCNLTASYTYQSGSPSGSVYFNNSTPGLASTDSVTWIFGDSSANSHDVNPVHIFQHSGTYNVCLIVKKSPSTSSTPCISYVCHNITVTVTPVCSLAASFTFTTDTATHVVHFTNTSTTPADSTFWFFGDGTTSSLQNPVHTYANAGVYNICLKIKNATPAGTTALCQSYSCHQDTIPATIAPCNITAGFNITAGNTPGVFYFTNTTTPIATNDSLVWSFGDSTTSNAYSPTHTYLHSGTYNVCLVVRRNNNNGSTPCVSYICHTVTVTIPPVCNIQAAFSYTVDSATHTIHCTNLSTPVSSADSITWTFGDSSISHDFNTSHTYANSGTYSVCLTVVHYTTPGAAPCTSHYCHTVTIPAQVTICNFPISYVWSADSSNHSTIHYTNNSIPGVSSATAIWSFGDGTTASTWNATHTYANPGRYFVCLRVQVSNTCVKYYCDSIAINSTINPCNLTAQFTSTGSNTNSQLYTFTPAVLNTTLHYVWSFGDSTGSSDVIAHHQYTHPGTYTVCLKVYRDSACFATVCNVITVHTSFNCNGIYINYTYRNDLYMPNKVYFYTLGNFPVLQESWTFTKLNSTAAPVILNQYNPAYVFNDTGYYSVCMTAITWGGCTKNFCDTIHITSLGNRCILPSVPNPAHTTVTVNVPLGQPETIHAYVFSMSNVLMLQQTVQGNPGSNVISFNVSGLAPGIYSIRLLYGTNTCYSRFLKL